MTSGEEVEFRKAARVALAEGSGDIAIVISDAPPLKPFMVLVNDATGRSVIVVPPEWGNDPTAEDRCHAILDEERITLTGAALN